MQQPADNAGHVELEIGNNIRHRHGVNEKGFAGQPLLTLMNRGGKITGFADEIDVRHGIVGLHFFNEIANFGFPAHDRFDPERKGSICHSLTRDVLARSASTIDFKASMAPSTSRLTT